MHTFAFVNQKGGCGKTTSALHLAGALAAGGGRVLLADLDPQAHATLGLGIAVEGRPTLAEVLIDGLPGARALRSAPGGIDLLPSCPRLAEFEELAARRLEPEQALRGVLAELADAYDYALLDCPPRTDGVLAANALRAADTAILVVEAGAFALQGAHQALAVLGEVALDMERPFDVRVLGTLFDRRTRLARELLIAMQARFGESLFDTAIHTSARLREAAAFGLPIQILDPTSRAARDFEALGQEAVEHARRSAPARPAELPRPAAAEAAGREGTRTLTC